MREVVNVRQKGFAKDVNWLALQRSRERVEVLSRYSSIAELDQ